MKLLIELALTCVFEYLNILCLAKKNKNSCTLIFCCSAFSFYYHVHLSLHFFKILCNITKCISIKSCINICQRSCFVYGRVKPLCKVDSSTYKDFQWSKAQDSVVANSLNSLNHSFTVWAQWILGSSSWNMAMKYIFQHGCLRNKKLHIASVRVNRTVVNHITC